MAFGDHLPESYRPEKREPKRRKEPQTVPAVTRIEGTSPKAEAKQLPKGSVGRSMQLILASKKRKAAKACTFSKRSRKASAKKVKGRRTGRSFT